MITPRYIPELSAKAFWDVDVNALHFQKNAEHIIKKVFDAGTFDDVLEVLVCYGDDAVKNVLVNAHYLDGRGRDLTCALYNLKPSDLKCFTKKAFHMTY